jgi:DNA-binding transcriptional ArsR family regulator
MGPEGACPGDIADKLELPAATLSFHLKALQHAGLIDADKSGRFIRYRVNFGVMRELLDFLSLNCCGGDLSKCAPKSVVAARRTSVKARAR